MRRARSCSCSSAETPMTSPSSVASAPSGGAKPGGGCYGPLELRVRRVVVGSRPTVGAKCWNLLSCAS
jgi:hypothetical protein